MDIGSSIMFYLRSILRMIVSFLDGIIYTIDAEVYDLMLRIANAQVFTETTLTEVAGRVYQLIALIMMFRLIFTFVTYVVNPDDIVDKKKGLGNIVKKIVITLALIIVTPWAFAQSRRVQTVIFDDGLIEYFIFGQDVNSGASGGYELMHTVGELFITPYACTNADCKSSSNKQALCTVSKWDEEIIARSDGSLDCSGDTCISKCGHGAGEDPNFAKALYKASHANDAKYDLQSMTSLAQYGKDDGNGWNSDFYVDYKFPFVGTTLIGIVIGYILISMCIDIAVRSIKLAFYEIISPIPIISYIGFKDGKDSMLSKWFNQVLKTYLDLFIRVAGLELAIFFIDLMLKEGFAENDFFVSIFLLIGALTFAKKLPDILKNLGLNLDTGEFSLKKKLTPLAPVTAAAAGAVGGMLGNFSGSRAAGRGMVGSLASGLAGTIPGALRGGAAGLKEKSGAGIRSGFAAGGKGGQAIYNKRGTDMGRYADRIRSTMGMKTEAESIENDIKVMDTYAGFKKQMKDNADFYNDGLSTASISGGEAKSYTTSTNATAIRDALNTGGKGGVKAIKQYYEDLQRSGTASQAEISAAREAYEDAQQYVIGNNLSAQVNYIKDQAARYVRANRRVLSTQTDSANASWKDLNSGFIQASNDATRVRSSEEYAKAQYNKNWAQSGQSKK